MKLAQFLFAILLGLTALTQQVRADDETPWYDIEIILFKQGSPSAGNTEQWPDDPGSPDWNNAIYLAAAEKGEDGSMPPYTRLPESQWQLNNLFNALQKTNGEIEPLLHEAWRQPVVSSKDAHPIYLGTGETPGLPTTPIEGLITIGVNRYLHVSLDLLLKGANESSTTLEAGESAPSPTRGSIRFTANRRMRSGELNYIDHPKMGALILISRVETPQLTAKTAQPPEAGSTEAPPPAPAAPAAPAPQNSTPKPATN